METASAPKTPSLPRWRMVLLAVLLLICVDGATLCAHEEASPAPGAAADAAIGITEHLGATIPLDAVFRDESGRPVRLGDIITGPTIILPVYFGCTNLCYNLQRGLAHTLPKIKSTPGTEYRVISFSFDEHDSPQLAAASKRIHLTAMNAPFPAEGWRFLTGDSENIKKLTAAAGYGFQRKGGDFLHPSVSFVVSGNGTIVRYLYGTAFLAKDLSLALIEAKNGTSGATIRKIVDYCFTFDPEQKTYAFNLLRVSATVVILCTGGFLLFLIKTGRKRKQRN